MKRFSIIHHYIHAQAIVSPELKSHYQSRRVPSLYTYINAVRNLSINPSIHPLYASLNVSIYVCTLEDSLDRKGSTDSLAAEAMKTKSLAPIPEVQEVNVASL